MKTRILMIVVFGAAVSLCIAMACNQPAAKQPAKQPPYEANDETNIDIEWPAGKKTLSAPIAYIAGLPTIRCNINGKPAKLILDTAAGEFSFYEDRLIRVGLTKTAETSDHLSYTAAGPVQRVFCDRFEMVLAGGVKLKVSRAQVLPAIARHKDNEVEGILGVEIMKALQAQIDLRNNLLVLSVGAQEPHP
jgi:hypothetical protein